MDFRSNQFSKNRDTAPKAAKSAKKTKSKRFEVEEGRSFVEAPRAPNSVVEMGLGRVFMRDILLKTVFRTNLETVSDMSKVLKISAPVCNEIIDICRSQQLVETLGSISSSDGSELRYQLTESGKSARNRSLSTI